MERDTVERLTALWKSGRDKYRSFYTVLNEVRKEIGDDKLAEWCVRELRIGMTVINNTAGILTKIDADTVRAELAAAARAERQKAQKLRLEKERLRKIEILAKEKRKLTAKIRDNTPILNKARHIIRPLVEQGKPTKSRELEKSHGISHVTFEMAITAERARRETIEELGFNGEHYLNGT